MISNQTVFPIPLYDAWGGSGSNTHVDVTGFVGFKITSYRATGSAAGRYIEGQFVNFVCNNGCTAGTSGNTTPGGGAVKLRLASRT